MRVHYQRVSSLLQNTERQKVDEKNYDLLLEDKCSGAVPFFERPSGMKIKEMCDKLSSSSQSETPVENSV
jgi:DNA invertase Pin-like site-specific DNA recombinase